jgi:hypothetical protein
MSEGRAALAMDVQPTRAELYAEIRRLEGSFAAVGRLRTSRIGAGRALRATRLEERTRGWLTTRAGGGAFGSQRCVR